MDRGLNPQADETKEQQNASPLPRSMREIIV
jgi:hypothetical protein